MLDIIVNPAGASGRTRREFEKKILPLFEKGTYRVHYSSRERGIEEIVRGLTGGKTVHNPGEREYGAAEAHRSPNSREIAGDGFVNLVIVGGDGTINEALNGIQDFARTRIGLIPCGSGNDLARDLDLPKDRRELVERICREETFRVSDLGEMILHDTGKKRYFAGSSGAGFDAQCCAMAERSPMKNALNRLGLGKLIYLFEAIRLIFTWKSFPVTVTYRFGEDTPEGAGGRTGEYIPAEGEDSPGTDFRKRKKRLYFGRFVFAAVMNHRYEGGGFMMSPEAEAGDGLLDACIVHDLKIPDFFRLFPSAVNGGHVKQKKVVQQERSGSFRIRSRKPFWVHCDGEAPWQSADAEFRISEERLNLMN